MMFADELDKLSAYKGDSPCPPDIDAFWAAALTELDSVDPAVQLIPAKCIFETTVCFDLYFTGVRGARIHAKLAMPKEMRKPAPAVLLFHGYNGRAFDWNVLLSYAGQGLVTAALDCRGQAGESEDKGSVRGYTFRGHIIRGIDEDDPHALLFRHNFLDTVELARIIMGLDSVDRERVSVCGGSQGGALAVACAALEPRIYRAAVMYPFLSDYRAVCKNRMTESAYVELSQYFRLFDPRHIREDEIFNKLGYIDIQNIAPRIKAQVIWATALMDTSCPPFSQFAAYNKIKSQKKMLVYPEYAHEWLPDWDNISLQFILGMNYEELENFN